MLCAQVKFSASIAPIAAQKNEYVTLRLIVENGVDVQKITPPNLNGFMVVSGPSQETGMSSINGAVTQYVALSYILQPLKSGKFNLGVATATIANKIYKSKPLFIEVSKSLGSGRRQQAIAQTLLPADADANAGTADIDFKDYVLHKGENVAEKVSKNMFLQLETSKKSCFVGEALVANYKFYSRLKSESRLSKNPSFNGFSVIDLSAPDDMQSPHAARVNGRDYNVYSIRKAQLYPLQAGDVTLDAATMENEIQFLKEGESSSAAKDLLNGFNIDPNAFITQAVSISSKPVTVQVKALPEEGKPVTFKGAVGNFLISAAVQKNTLAADETGNLIITISGSGNLQLITAPDLSWPQGVSGFEPQLTETIDNSKIPISGEKIFVYPFTIQNSGSFSLPAATLSFFNPNTAQYKTIITNSLKVTILKAIAPAKLNRLSASASSNYANVLGTNWWWGIIAVTLLVALGMYYYTKNLKSNLNSKMVKADVLSANLSENSAIAAVATSQRNPLELSEICLLKEDCYRFFELLNQELKQFLSTKFLIAVGSINSSSISFLLDRKGVDNETILQTEKLFKALELQLYSPLKQNELGRQFYSEAQVIVQVIKDDSYSVNL